MDMKERGTVVDFVQWVEERDLVKDTQRGDEDQKALSKLLRRQATTNHGKSELTKELAAQEKKPSQKSMVGGLRKNRDEEMLALRSASGPSAAAEKEALPADAVGAAIERSDAASEAMEAFMKEVAA